MREMPHVGNHGKGLHKHSVFSAFKSQLSQKNKQKQKNPGEHLEFMGWGQRRFDLQLQISTALCTKAKLTIRM